MSELWPVKQLADICEIFSDGNWIESKDQSPSGIRLVQTGNIGEGVFKDRKDKARYISESTFSHLNCSEIFEGDCLISRLPRPVGRACLIPNTGERMITAVDCSILRFKQDMILPQYFVYYSQSAHYNNQIQPLCTGSTRKRISRKNLGKIKISIPPLEEQQRIVSILEEAFETISKNSIINSEKFSKIENLFESYLNQIFTKEENNWDAFALGETCHFENGDRGTNYPKRAEYVEDGIPWINTGHILPNGTLDRNSMNYITEEKFRSLRSGKTKPGDLVYCLRGATLGKTAIVDSNAVGAVASSLVIIRPSEKILSKFLYFFLTSNTGKSFIKQYQNGAAQPNLGAKSVKKFIIPLPSINVQEKIVSEMEDCYKNYNLLQSLRHKSDSTISELKQSILQEAFNGKLTGGIAA